MKLYSLITISVSTFCLFSQLSFASSTGFQFHKISDPDDQPFEIGIWYPTDAEAPAEPNTPFLQALSINSEPAGANLPVVLMSHGYGGWMAGHADTALTLAQSGYVVVAPTHTGNNYEDESYPPSRWMQDRPRHIRLALDYILSSWESREIIDPGKVGIFGFSAGGYTALVSSGAIPDIKTMLSYCADSPEELACTLGLKEDPKIAELAELFVENWGHDSRISAAVVVAPGLGFAFNKQALKQITIPVQLWAAANDKNVPYKSNTAIVRQSLPQEPDYHQVENAGHFAFLPPCNPRLKGANPEVWNMVCVDDPSFDRTMFHLIFNQKVLDFFNKSLGK
ncbi:dienelactone hydrolase family protein [Kiloniella laminariae]|uniref:Dienelactone hydrolase family protein n=1 Tax=Kiloniella laminariae TaxID=454162 RepID=A0ABT4LNQ5_9PROT|nr:dienelactone hydrolase family protein [Kiloniella laminariae]MCZ4282525.1 dienelactone hydrolase family protein [Kiloniella laminariae]